MNEYFDRVHNGVPINDIEIIDMHAHLGPYYQMHVPVNDADGMVKLMDRCGINKTVISADVALTSDFVVGNSEMLKALESHPGRLYGACAANGHYPELSVEELERCFENKAVVIIKIHPILAGCRMDDPGMKGIYEFASKRKLFILVHTWIDSDPYGNQDLFTSVAKDYPDVKWVMGHSGGPLGSKHAVELAADVPNIFFDITLSLCPARQVEWFVKEVGAERILFGTDNPFIDPRPQIGRFCLADITREERVLIMGGNARKYIDFE